LLFTRRTLRRNVKMINHASTTYRRYYYYGSLSARRSEAAMNCLSVIIV